MWFQGFFSSRRRSSSSCWFNYFKLFSFSRELLLVCWKLFPCFNHELFMKINAKCESRKNKKKVQCCKESWKIIIWYDKKIEKIFATFSFSLLRFLLRIKWKVVFTFCGCFFFETFVHNFIDKILFIYWGEWEFSITFKLRLSLKLLCFNNWRYFIK